MIDRRNNTSQRKATDETDDLSPTQYFHRTVSFRHRMSLSPRTDRRRN